MKIYHNDQCSKSNLALELIKKNGENYQIVDYLGQPPTKKELIEILAMLNLKPADIVRKKGSVFFNKYDGKTFSDDQWLDILIGNPELIERPIVVKDGKAVIARPAERIFELV